MLKLIKKGDKYWLFEDSQIGLFSPSKFTINLELNEIVIVYENGLKSKRYNVSDCEIYDLGELTPFTTSSGDLFMQKLEELNCPCFQKNENIFNISGGAWGDITGNLSNQTDLQTALDSKLDKDTTAGVERAYIINADGSQSTKPTSELGNTQSYFTFSTNTTLSNAHHNAVIWVTATCNITIPSGLRSDFNCTFRTLTGAIATFLTSGTTINAESDGDVQAAKTMSFLAQYTTNNYIISGGGLS